MTHLIIFGAQYLIFILLLVAGLQLFIQTAEVKKRIVLFGLITLPIIFLVAQLSAALYSDPRPFVVGHFTPLIAHSADNGFPSDHALLASAVAMVMFFFNRKLGFALWILTLLVGLSRVLAGVHHPVDIAGSFIISILITTISYNYLLPIAQRQFLNK